MFTVPLVASPDPREVPEHLRVRLRKENLSDVGRRAGVSRGALLNMRDKGRARADTIARVEQALAYATQQATPPPSADISGKPLPTLFRRYALLRARLSPEQLDDVALFESEMFRDSARYLTDPDERHEQAVLSTVRYIERRYLNARPDDIPQG